MPAIMFHVKKTLPPGSVQEEKEKRDDKVRWDVTADDDFGGGCCGCAG